MFVCFVFSIRTACTASIRVFTISTPLMECRVSRYSSAKLAYTQVDWHLFRIMLFILDIIDIALQNLIWIIQINSTDPLENCVFSLIVFSMLSDPKQV